MNNQHWTQLVTVLALVGFSVLSWIFKKLQEQAQIKRARDAIEKRELEMLRTGRDPSQEAAPAPARQETAVGIDEAAARREAQLRELRRRAAARSQPGGGAVFVPPRPGGHTGARGPILIIPGSTGPTVPQPARAAQPARTSSAPRPTGRQIVPTPLPIPRQAGRSRATPRKPPPLQQRPAPHDHDDGESVVHTLISDISHPQAPPTAEPDRRAGPAKFTLSPSDLRRAVILREIFDPPLSERSSRDSGELPF